VVVSLVVAFLETVALWWLYFGAPAEDSRAAVVSSENPRRLARDAYTYVQVLIVGGIVATAAADNLLIADPHARQHGVGLAIAERRSPPRDDADPRGGLAVTPAPQPAPEVGPRALAATGFCLIRQNPV
jgi:hypothetical protein